MTPTTSRTPPSTTTTTVNEVHVVGRITTEPTERELPSGDVLVALRVSVPRDPPPRRTDPEEGAPRRRPRPRLLDRGGTASRAPRRGR
ncbi:hypothetical protein [Arsenicicoccus piscis]|uniref:hypothetical protein n=1 Tax=Arsenicicoccus piscis TaxID=673954 RepID=UPI0032AFD6DA